MLAQGPRVPDCRTCTRTRCGTRAATILPTRARICAPCRTISATAIRVTPCTTRVSPAGDLKGCGGKPTRLPAWFDDPTCGLCSARDTDEVQQEPACSRRG